MLDGARNTDTHEKLGRNRYAGLANLMAILQPAGLHDRSRATKLGSQSLGEPSHQGQILLGANAAAHHDQALGIGDRGLLPPLLGGNRDLDTSLSIIRKRYLGDRAGTAVVKVGRLKDAGTNRCHLGTMIGADDGGHQVAAKRRTRLLQQSRLRIHRKYGAVSRKARLQAHGNAGCQFAAKSGRTV